jgi:hypothetical protein
VGTPHIKKWQWFRLILGVFILTDIMLIHSRCILAGESLPSPLAIQEPPPLRKRINFIAARGRPTSNPPGWEAYDGSIYTDERGYGWLTDLSGSGWDRGENGEITR